MTYYILATLYVIVCLLMMVVVLLQRGKGDVSSAFGGAGTQTAFGARQGATVLTRATTVLGALFMIGAFVLAMFGQRGPRSVIGGFGGPEPTQQTAPAEPGAAQEAPPETEPQADQPSATPSPPEGKPPPDPQEQP